LLEVELPAEEIGELGDHPHRYARCRRRSREARLDTSCNATHRRELRHGLQARLNLPVDEAHAQDRMRVDLVLETEETTLILRERELDRVSGMNRVEIERGRRRLLPR